MTLQQMHRRAEAGRRRDISARHATNEALLLRSLVEDGAEVAARQVRNAARLQGRADRVVTPVVVAAPVKDKTIVAATTTSKIVVVVTTPKVTVPVVSAKATTTSAIVASTNSVAATVSASGTTSATLAASTASTTTPVIPSTTVPLPVSETNTSSSVIASSTILRTPSGPHVASSTQARTATASGSSVTASNVPSSTGGISTGTLIGIIGGVVGGLFVIALVIGFFLRRLRKQNKDRGAFKAETFRRSAIMLKDEQEKADFRPRPPSMIERRNAATPALGGNGRANLANIPTAPPSLYGNEQAHQYSQFGAASASYPAVPPAHDAYGQPQTYNAVPGAYGLPPPLAPYGGAQYEQAGFGAPPIPGTYGPGAYAAYGPDPRYPQYPHQQQGYPQYSHYQQQQRQHAQYGEQQMIGYGNPAADMSRSESLTSSHSIPNAFARSPSSSPPPAPQLSEKQQLREAERLAEMGSASASSSSTTLTRKPTQSSGAPPAYTDDGDSALWAARRDQKRPHEIVMTVSNDGAERSVQSASNSVPKPASIAAVARATPPAATVQRPTSVYTLYGEEDAYGGM